jgi:hypothetical protein
MIVSEAPNCGITYDCHYDDRNSFIIQATELSKVRQQNVTQFIEKDCYDCLSCSCLAAALSLMKFITLIAINQVTLCCGA